MKHIIQSMILLALVCSCSEGFTTEIDDSPKQDEPYLSPIRDGYFETRIKSLSGDSDIDDLLQSTIVAESYTINLKTTPKEGVVPVSRDCPVEIVCTVYPLHSFDYVQGISSAGDYYVVETIVSICTGNAYLGPDYEVSQIQTINGKKVNCVNKTTGFYLKGLTMTATLSNESGKQSGTFIKTPVPATSQGSTTYTEGMTYNFGGAFWGNASLPTINGSFQYEKTESGVINDLKVLNNSTSSGTVSLTYELNNIRSKNLAPISYNTLDLPSAWIWYIPEATGSTQYHIDITLSDFTFGMFYESDKDERKYTDKFTLSVAPKMNRTATGTIIVKNRSKDKYFTNPCLQTVSGGNTYTDNTNSAYGPGQSYSVIVPEGEYRASVVSNDSTITFDKTYVLDLKDCPSQEIAFN